MDSFGTARPGVVIRLFLSLFLVVSALLGQSPTGEIRIELKDPSGAVVEEALAEAKAAVEVVPAEVAPAPAEAEAVAEPVAAVEPEKQAEAAATEAPVEGAAAPEEPAS